MSPSDPGPCGDRGEPLRRPVIRALLASTSAALVAGRAAWLLGARDVADICWAAGTLVAVIPAVWWVVAALRHGRVGADVIAVLALVGTLAVHEYLAGALIGVMLATGRALDVAAERRAAKDLRSLLERSPRVARRRTGDGLETIPLGEVAPGDMLVVGPGEMLPVDARIVSDGAVAETMSHVAAITPTAWPSSGCQAACWQSPGAQSSG